jgi:hypothetical protein
VRVALRLSAVNALTGNHVLESFDTEIDQVRSSGELQRGEDDGRACDDRPDAEGHGDHQNVRAERVPDDSGEGRSPTVCQCPPDHEQHARARNDDQQERHRSECEQAVGGDHAAIE